MARDLRVPDILQWEAEGAVRKELRAHLTATTAMGRAAIGLWDKHRAALASSRSWGRDLQPFHRAPPNLSAEHTAAVRPCSEANKS